MHAIDANGTTVYDCLYTAIARNYLLLLRHRLQPRLRHRLLPAITSSRLMAPLEHHTLQCVRVGVATGTTLIHYHVMTN